MHMLRRRLGDERFLKMLAELRRRYEFRAVSTDDFRALVKEFRPRRTSVTLIDEFFDNWVYSSGVPSLSLRYSAKGAAPSVKLSGTIAQSGVDDEFSVEVPLEIRFAKGAPQVIWVRTSNEAMPFTATLRQAPVRVAVATSSVLATKK
jgi:aminopeptidase N